MVPLLLMTALAAWPDSADALQSPAARTDTPKRPFRILIDAGHGSPNNAGNTSLDCEKESAVMLLLADGLATRLALDPRFEVRLTRRADELPNYRARLDQANDWPADAFVSLHSDVRGWARPEYRTATCIGFRNDAAAGFAVLWSDDGAPRLSSHRGLLARTTAAALRQAGFLAYRGDDYPGLYDDDAENPGVFVDRHVPGQRIYLLRKPRVPSIIIETHHALDAREVERWRELKVHDVFAAAVAKGLLDALSR